MLQVTTPRFIDSLIVLKPNDHNKLLVVNYPNCCCILISNKSDRIISKNAYALKIKSFNLVNWAETTFSKLNGIREIVCCSQYGN